MIKFAQIRKYAYQTLGSFLMGMNLMLFSCSSSNEQEAETLPTPQLVFLFSPGGLGDMSYNDRILEGVQQFKMDYPQVDLYLYSPASLEEAEKIFSDWIQKPGQHTPALFTLASSDYEPIVEKLLVGKELTSNKKVLLFESSKQYAEGISTFQISMFGASYLAGITASEITNQAEKALIVLANNTDSPIHIAREGFMTGFQGTCATTYLANDWTGYISANLAYRKMKEWGQQYPFIFPVAGGSNAGIYRYSREYDSCPYLVGMDIDQSHLSNQITGSVIKHIDRLIYHYLSEWATVGKLPASQLYGLESGYVDWVVSPLFQDALQSLVENHRQTAITQEKAYYEDTQP